MKNPLEDLRGKLGRWAESRKHKDWQYTPTKTFENAVTLGIANRSARRELAFRTPKSKIA